MNETDYGALIIGRNKDPNEPWKAGDDCDVYVLAEPLDLTPRVGVPQIFDPHDLDLPEDLLSYRVEQTLRCTCKAGRALAKVYASPRGIRWVVVPPEQIPRRFDKQPRFVAHTGFPMHREPNGRPHITLSYCNRCRTRWVLSCTEREITRVRVKTVRHDRSVAP